VSVVSDFSVATGLTGGDERVSLRARDKIAENPNLRSQGKLDYCRSDVRAAAKRWNE
jgi:hypothetical protein